MITLLFFYFVLPALLAFLVLRFIKKHGASTQDPQVRALLDSDPLVPKWQRAVRRDAKGLLKLGDFETHLEAVDCAYKAKEQAQAAGDKASFLVVNEKAEILEQVDS